MRTTGCNQRPSQPQVRLRSPRQLRARLSRPVRAPRRNRCERDIGLVACASEAWTSSPMTSWVTHGAPGSVHPSWRRFDVGAPMRLWLGRTRSARSPCSGRRSSKAVPEVLLHHAERTLLLCWPDPWSGFDEASLLAYPGEHVAVVGEPGE